MTVDGGGGGEGPEVPGGGGLGEVGGAGRLQQRMLVCPEESMTGPVPGLLVPNEVAPGKSADEYWLFSKWMLQ